MAAGADVEAGKAYVTFYLRRVTYDQQIDQLQRDNQELSRETADSLPAPKPSTAAADLAAQATAQARTAAAAVADIGNQGTPALKRLVHILEKTAAIARQAAAMVSQVPADQVAQQPARPLRDPADPAAVEQTRDVTIRDQVTQQPTPEPERRQQTPSIADAAAAAASQPTTVTEVGVSMPADLAASVAKGAAMRTGAAMLEAGTAKARVYLDALRGIVPATIATTTATSAAAPAMAAVGTAAASTATATAAVAASSTAAGPALAATGTAAAGASVGFGALVTAALPILLPLAAIAAAAGVVYVAFAKWDKLPLWAKGLMLVLSPLVVICRAVALAVHAVGAAVSVVTAPFRLAAGAVGLLRKAVGTIPSAIASLPGLFQRAGSAALDMGTRVARGAAHMAAAVVRHVAATVAALARLPGQIASHAAAAVDATAAAVRGLGMSIGKAGLVAGGLSAAIVGPMALAAKEYAAAGDAVRKLQNDYQRFELSAEEASLLKRVSEQTGESVGKLAEQLRDGTRDFSRWRNEIQASGTEMSGAGLSAALALSRAYYSLRESVTGLRLAVGAALAPVIQDTTEVITGAISGVIRWVNENRPLVVQVFKIASAVGVAAVALTTLGGALVGTASVLSPFTAGLAAIAAGLAVVEYRTGTGRTLWATYADSVRRVYEKAREYLGQMFAFVGRVMGGVRDALAAGDLAGAVNIAWTAAKVAWITGLMELSDLTGGAFDGIFANLAAGRWSAAGEAAMNALQQAWLSGIGILSGLWGRVADAADSIWVDLQNGFSVAMGAMEKAWIRVMESMKSWGLSTVAWIANKVLHPLVQKILELDPTGILGEKAKGAYLDLARMHQNAKRELKKPEEIAAEEAAIDARVEAERAANEAAGTDRTAARQGKADRARLARETEIEKLRRRQAELAKEAGPAAKEQLAANKAALDKAIEAAAAARAAADVAKPKEEDFAVSAKTESITRFSGEALSLSVGRADDPAKRIEKHAEKQVRHLEKIVTVLDDNLQEIMRLQGLGGFA